MKNSSRTHCIRCGECCRTSSPTLEMADLSLLEGGDLQRSDLFTIRTGELVRDNIQGGLTTARREMIKVREKGETKGGCLFYEEADKSCRIYGRRPLQCAVLKCWDTTDFMEVYRQPKPARRDILTDGVLLGLIREHDRRCAYSSLKTRVEEIAVRGEAAVDEILDLLKFDYEIRPFASRKLGLNPDEMDFIFGRPLLETIAMFGLRVIREGDGAFLLST